MNLRDIHTPVLLDRCVELLAPAARARRRGARRCDARHGRPCRGVPRALSRAAPHRPRPRPRRPGDRRGAARAVRRPGDARAHRVRRDRRGGRIDRTITGRRHPLRSRRLLAPARRGRPRLRVRAGRAAGHADGPDLRHDGRRHPRDLRRGRPAPHLRALRRREAVRPLRARHHQGAAGGADRTIRPARVDPPRRDACGGAAARDTPPSGSSRRCGSRSTASSPYSNARFPPGSICSAWAGGWS